MTDTLYRAALAAKLADDKKAADVVLLDVHGLCNFADAFVVCSGNNRHQLRAIADNIVDGLRKTGARKPSEDAMPDANWAILDYGDVIVHLMTPEARSFYRLEALWGDAPPQSWEQVLSDNPVAAGFEG